MLVMSLLSLLLFSLFLGNPIEKIGPFIGLVLLGGWSLSLVFTFLAAIAAKAQQNAAIMAVLGFPLIIPQLLLLMRLSNAAFNPALTVSTNASPATYCIRYIDNNAGRDIISFFMERLNREIQTR